MTEQANITTGEASGVHWLVTALVSFRDLIGSGDGAQVDAALLEIEHAHSIGHGMAFTPRDAEVADLWTVVSRSVRLLLRRARGTIEVRTGDGESMFVPTLSQVYGRELVTGIVRDVLSSIEAFEAGLERREETRASDDRALIRTLQSIAGYPEIDALVTALQIIHDEHDPDPARQVMTLLRRRASVRVGRPVSIVPHGAPWGDVGSFLETWATATKGRSSGSQAGQVMR